jgi:RimJ/RimL family protein N-acetyltransferase
MNTRACLIQTAGASEPEVGRWIKEAMHGYGFGREAVAAVVSFAARLGKQAVLYPVVEQNLIAIAQAARLLGAMTRPLLL